MASAKLQIEIISADNLYNSDGVLAGKSDPYVIVEVPGQPNMKFQTPVINNCLSPVWNFVGEIDGFMDGDTLEFQVWDSDTWPKPDQLLGKAMLTAQDFYPNGLEGPLMLSESPTEATLTVRVIVVDTVDPGAVVEGQVEYQEQVIQQGVEGEMVMEQMEGNVVVTQQAVGPQTLHVNIMNARGLYNADGILAGKSDPYCICLIPEKPNSKFQTKTINNCLDPDWNYTGQIAEFEAGDSLEFQVWDSDTFPKPDQLLGKVTLTPQDFEANPDGIAGVLQLSGGISGDQGTLEVKIGVDVAATIAEGEQAPEETPSAPVAGGIAQPGVQRLTGSQHLDKLQGAKMCKIKVTVFSASGLYNADGFLAGKSDPYVICEVPEQKTKVKTKVINNSLEPVWNQILNVSGFVVGHTLELAVFDSDTPPKPDQLLGKVVLASDEFFPDGLEGSLILAESKAAGATLKVRIEVLPDTAATGLAGARLTTGSITMGGRPTVIQYQPGQYQPGAVYYQQPMVTTGSIGSVQYVTGAPTYTYTTAMPAQASAVSQAVTSAAFEAIDANHDGVISRSEFSKAVAAEPVATAAAAAQPVPQPVAAPVTYTTVQAPAPATYTMPTTYTVPATPVPAEPTAALSATTQKVQTVAYAAPMAMTTAAPRYSVAPAQTVYMKPASTVLPPTTVTMPAVQAATTVAPTEPVVASAAAVATPTTITMAQPAPVTTVTAAPKVVTGASASIGTQPVTYAAQPTIMAAAPATTTVAAPQYVSAASTRVTYAAAPGMAYTMAPQIATTAVPVQATATGQPLFDRLDKNHDGVISRSEFTQALR